MDDEDYGDGVYKVRIGNNNEKLIQMSQVCHGEYRRFTEDDGERVIFQKV
jgi:hypothetical protein